MKNYDCQYVFIVCLRKQFNEQDDSYFQKLFITGEFSSNEEGIILVQSVVGIKELVIQLFNQCTQLTSVVVHYIFVSGKFSLSRFFLLIFFFPLIVSSNRNRQLYGLFAHFNSVSVCLSIRIVRNTCLLSGTKMDQISFSCFVTC